MNGEDNGELPEGWAAALLRDVTTIVMGNSPPGESYNDSGNGEPLINGPVEFGQGPLDKTIRAKFTTEPSKFCEEGDLIVCVRGSTTGRTNVAGFRACIGRGVASVRAMIHQPYVNHFVVSCRKQLLDMGTGSTFPNITQSQVETLTIPIPPLAEQRRIVAAVEAVLAKVNAARERLNRVPAILKRFRRAVLSAACSGRLTADWREKNTDGETATMLLQRIREERALRAPKRADIDVSYPDPLFDLPETWEWTTWHELVDWVTYGFTRPMPHVNEGIAIVTAKNIDRSRITFDGADFTTATAFAELSDKDRPRRGEILVTKDAGSPDAITASGFPATNGPGTTLSIHRKRAIKQRPPGNRFGRWNGASRLRGVQSLLAEDDRDGQAISAIHHRAEPKDVSARAGFAVASAAMSARFPKIAVVRAPGRERAVSHFHDCHSLLGFRRWRPGDQVLAVPKCPFESLAHIGVAASASGCSTKARALPSNARIVGKRFTSRRLRPPPLPARPPSHP